MSITTGTVTLASGETRQATYNDLKQHSYSPLYMWDQVPTVRVIAANGSMRQATAKQAATFVADSWVTDVEAAHSEALTEQSDRTKLMDWQHSDALAMNAEIDYQALLADAVRRWSVRHWSSEFGRSQIDAMHAEALAYEMEQAALAYGAALTDDTMWKAATPGTATYFGEAVPARYSTAADALWLYRPVYDTGVVGWARVFIAAQTFIADSWVTDSEQAHSEALAYLTGWQSDQFVSGTVKAFPFESEQRYPARLYSDGRLTVAVGWRTYGTDQPRYESLAATTLATRIAIVASWVADTDATDTDAYCPNCGERTTETHTPDEWGICVVTDTASTA